MGGQAEMRRKIEIVWILLVFALISCLREDSLMPKGNEADGVRRVTVEFELPGAAPGTKALANLADLEDLNTLHLAVFGGSGYLQEYVQAELLEKREGYQEHQDRSDTTYTIHIPDPDNPGQTIDQTSPLVPHYVFRASLAISNNPRTVHLLGNGPSRLSFGYDTSVLPALMTGVGGSGEMCYWQMVSLPNGIRAKMDQQGHYLDKDGNIIPDDVNEGFVPDETTEKAFIGIPLIRNWAKIEVEDVEGSNFTTKSFAVINVPNRGTLVPYYTPRVDGETGFISAYQEMSCKELEALPYLGNLPSNTGFETSIPESFDPQNPSPGVAVSSTFADRPDGWPSAAYLYERPVPSDYLEPSYVIVYGRFNSNRSGDIGKPYNNKDYYYKIDLMETKKENGKWTSKYYPIYRNFKYRVKIKEVLAPGQNSAQEAAASAGSADVSASTSTSELTDISDGVGRLWVSPWIAHTFTEGCDENHPFTDLQVYFSDMDGVPYMDDEDVTLELLDANETFLHLTDNNEYHNGMKSASTEETDRGWRRFSFWFEGQSTTRHTQTLRITGHHGEGRIYRDVVISVQPLEQMNVRCVRESIPEGRGEEQAVEIDIPDGLAKSIFPLEFKVEAVKMTLSPDNSKSDNNLPVSSGESISGSGKSAFYFIRTLTWDDYQSLNVHKDEMEQTWRTFTCYFITNQDVSATEIYVYNKYFLLADTEFKNDNYKFFQDCGFEEAILEGPAAKEQTLHLSFALEPPGDDQVYPPYVYISIGGLTFDPDMNPGISIRQTDVDTYALEVDSNHPEFRLTLIPTVEDASFFVDLDAYGYAPTRVKPYRFSDVGFVDGHPLSGNTFDSWATNKWSNVVWGHVNKDDNKTLLFAYKDDPGKLNTPVTISTPSNLKKEFSMRMPLELKTYSNQSSCTFTPTAPRSSTSDEGYHEIELKSVRATSGQQPVSFTLSSPGYVSETVTAPRFNGNIITWTNVANGFVSGNYNNSDQSLSFTVKVTTEGKDWYCRLLFEGVDEPSSKQVVIPAGTTCTLTIEQTGTNKANKGFFYVNLFYVKDSMGKVFAHESVRTRSGDVFKYPGDTRQYIWSIPKPEPQADCDVITLEITAPDNHDVRLQDMYIKTYRTNGGNFPL